MQNMMKSPELMFLLWIDQLGLNSVQHNNATQSSPKCAQIGFFLKLSRDDTSGFLFGTLHEVPNLRTLLRTRKDETLTGPQVQYAENLISWTASI